MDKKTNILLIAGDQLTWRALSCYGSPYAKDSNISRIASKGIKFEQAYSICPLCQPARAGFWTGRYPHETSVLSNGRKCPVPDISGTFNSIGKVFSSNGYETVHFGKTHDSGGLSGFRKELKKSVDNFESVHEAFPFSNDTKSDRNTAENTREFLTSYNGDKPYFAVADFNNPHDICSWVGANKNVHDDMIMPDGTILPELPVNFSFDDIRNRPPAVQYICCSHNRQAQAAGWTESNYRHYLAAYYYYLEQLDKEVGVILDALDSRSDSDNTLIVFYADHGDSMAARGRVTKQVDFYEEVTRIPFIWSGPGIASGCSSTELVSQIDLFPTLCGYAGITIPSDLRGIDLTPVLHSEKNNTDREYVVSEWHTEWGYTISPGRMIRSRDFKYIKYLEGDSEELYDMKNDPYEMVNLISNTAYTSVLNDHRRMLDEYICETNDPFYSYEWKADSMWRSHPIGYQNHKGIAAPQYEL